MQIDGLRNLPFKQPKQNTSFGFYIGGLPISCQQSDLCSYFGQFGKVISTVVQKSKEGKSKGCGEVFYETLTPVEYEGILRRKHFILGKEIEVQRYVDDPNEKKKQLMETNEKSIHVSCLPPGVTENDIYNYFKQYGKIARAYIIFRDDGSSRGFGFIRFEQADSATAVLKDPRHVLQGRELKVSRKNTKNEEKQKKEPSSKAVSEKSGTISAVGTLGSLSQSDSKQLSNPTSNNLSLSANSKGVNPSIPPLLQSMSQAPQPFMASGNPLLYGRMTQPPQSHMQFHDPMQYQYQQLQMHQYPHPHQGMMQAPVYQPGFEFHGQMPYPGAYYPQPVYSQMPQMVPNPHFVPPGPMNSGYNSSAPPQPQPVSSSKKTSEPKKAAELKKVPEQKKQSQTLLEKLPAQAVQAKKENRMFDASTANLGYFACSTKKKEQTAVQTIIKHLISDSDD